MGIAERKEREKEEMKKLILRTASELFLENGYEKTSIRNIAEAIEYSPATIYLYFKDKNDLFYSLSEEAFREFFKYLSQTPDLDDPLERLQALGHQYFKFALDNPAYYDLMLILRAPMESHHTEEGWELGLKSHSVLTTIVNECIQQGYFKNKDPEVLSFMIWSFVHGAVSLKIRDRMKMHSETNQGELLFGALDYFNQMLSRI
jgi:AcrR family transcriptional regulator